MSRAKMELNFEHREFVAMLDCLVLGITEAVSDMELERPTRVDPGDVLQAIRIAEHMTEAIRTGRIHDHVG
jgi:hypothetical protein